jgi:hypothetical protein
MNVWLHVLCPSRNLLIVPNETSTWYQTDAAGGIYMIGHVICSTLARCYETAGIILNVLLHGQYRLVLGQTCRFCLWMSRKSTVTNRTTVLRRRTAASHTNNLSIAPRRSCSITARHWIDFWRHRPNSTASSTKFRAVKTIIEG